MVLIKVEHLSLGYEKNIIVKDLNLEIEEGSYTSIVGENGAGKTSFLKTLLRLIPQIEGKIELLNDLNMKDFSYLPQQAEIKDDFPATVKEIVMSGFLGKMGMRPFYNSTEKEFAKQMMIKTGVIDIQNKCYRELSGGQRQRVLLTRALCVNGRVLVLDEPTQGLDPIASEMMYDSIKKLNEEGMTIIMVSHDIESSLKYSSNILHIGKESFYGTTEEYINSKIGVKFIGGVE